MKTLAAMSVTYNLKQSQVSCWYVVECNDWLEPGVIKMLHLLTLQSALHLAAVDQFAICINTVAKSTGKKTNAHYTENQPEYETHQQDIENCRNSLYQSIDHNLKHIRNKSYKNCWASPAQWQFRWVLSSSYWWTECYILKLQSSSNLSQRIKCQSLTKVSFITDSTLRMRPSQ